MNRKLLNQINAIAENNRKKNINMASERDTYQIYAALALALYRVLDMPEHDKADAVGTVFLESQKIWNDAITHGKDVVEMCEKETGISVRYSVGNE